MIIQIIQFVLALTILVFLHELGHFTFAKLFKTRVTRFYIFANWKFHLFSTYDNWWRKLWRKPLLTERENGSKKYNDEAGTEYGIGWLPIGGYCAIDGMVDETQSAEELAKKPVQPWEFRSKKRWQKLLIMAGGVMVNFILAFIIYSACLYTWGEKYIATRDMTFGMAFNEDAEQYGFKDGDVMLGTDKGDFLAFGADMYRDLAVAKECRVLRDGTEVKIELPGDLDLLQMMKAEPKFVEPFCPKGMTIKQLYKTYKVTSVEYGLLECVPAGIGYGMNVLGGYVGDLKYLFSAEGAKSLGGFGTIGSLFPETWNWQIFWMMTAFLSIILAFMNVLPIPGLDGGHILFLIYEMIFNKEPGMKFQTVAQNIGFGILIALMILANLNDILRWLGVM